MLDQRKELEATRAGIQRDLHTLERRWASCSGIAEEHAKDLEPGRGGWFGRGATTWTVRQERWFQERLHQLVELEAPNVRAIMRRIDRASAAEAVLAGRLRLNEPWRVDRSPVTLWLAALAVHA